MRIIDFGHIRLVKYDKNGGTIDKDINEGPVLTDGKANAEGNVSDGIHPSIDSTAKKFMNKIGSMMMLVVNLPMKSCWTLMGKGKQLLK